MLNITNKRQCFGYRVGRREGDLAVIEIWLDPTGRDVIPLVIPLVDLEATVVRLSPFGACEVCFSQEEA